MEEAADQQNSGKIARTAAFRELMRRKRAFVIPATVFALVFFFTLPVLAGFTTVLNGLAIGGISWAYLYGFAQFALAVVLSHLYVRQANRFDELAEKAEHEASDEKEDLA